jgi:hypothetical protein
LELKKRYASSMGRYASSSLRVEGGAAEEGSRTRWYREAGWFTPPREWAAATAAAREEAAAREAARASFHATDGIAS